MKIASRGKMIVADIDTLAELQAIVADATLIDVTQIDTLAELNAILTDATIVTTDATASATGLATATQITKLDAVEASADVTDVANVLTAMTGNTGSVSDNTASTGQIVKEGTGTLVLGQAYYLDTDSGWKDTDADAAATAGPVLVGIALGTSVSTNGLVVPNGSIIDATAAIADHSPGKVVYLSTTAGLLTTTAPSATGDIVRAMGWCLPTADEILFAPSGDWVEVA